MFYSHIFEHHLTSHVSCQPVSFVFAFRALFVSYFIFTAIPSSLIPSSYILHSWLRLEDPFDSSNLEGNGELLFFTSGLLGGDEIHN